MNDNNLHKIGAAAVETVCRCRFKAARKEIQMFFGSRKKSNKKEDGKFHSKHVKHDPQSQSARTVFGLKKGGNE